MAQKQEGLAIGIDLGTTYSCVGVWGSGRVEIIPNELGHKKTPSYVAFSDTRRLIGEEAKGRVSSNATNTIFNVKRLMGRRSYDDSPVNELWPFKVEFDPKNHRCVLPVNYNGKEKRFSPEEISSMLLMKMRQIAEAYLGTTVRNAVISVPAHFNTAQRQATMDAGVIAGLNVMRLINEPSAAAFAYGFDRSAGWERGKNVLIFDLGGGTLDVSLLKIGRGTVKVMSTAGDTHLGGEDFDQAMVNHCIEEFKKKHKVDLGGNLKAVRRLKAACEKAKIELSVTNQATIEIDCLYEEIDFSSTITCSQFVKLNSPLLEKCKEIVERCLREANAKSKDIDEVLLVGGSSRVPMVQDMLRGYFNKELCKAINADEAVAYGATLQAAMLTYRKVNEEMPRLVLEDATPLDLRVSVNQTTPTTMCRKNKTIPHSLKFPSQWHSVRSLDVYEDRYLLTSLSSSNSPVNWRQFVIDENGMWSALGWDTNTNQETKAAIPMGRLNGEEIQRMVREAENYDFQDKEHNKRVEEKNSMEKFIYDVRKAINDKKMEGRLDAVDKKKIKAAIEEAIEWLSTSSSIEVKEYKKKMVQLQHICHPILGKLHKEKEKETDDSSPNGDAGSSAPARYTHNSNDAGKSKGKRPHSDNIAESNLAIGTSHGASGTDENKAISRPKTDVKNVCPGGNLLLESVVLRSCGGPTTSKLRVTLGDTDSKVEIFIETKVEINVNQLDNAHHDTILPDVAEWVKGVGFIKQISSMLEAKIVSNTRSSSSGSGYSQNMKVTRRHRSSCWWCCWFGWSPSQRRQL